MYLHVTVTDGYSASSYEGRRLEHDVYLIGKPRWHERWAVKRLTASYPRYAVQNTVFTLVLLGLHVWLIIQAFAHLSEFWATGYAFITSIVIGITLIVRAASNETYTVSDIYTWLAARWLTRRNPHALLFDANASLTLRVLAGQVTNKQCDANLGYIDTMSWLQSHPELDPKIDALLVNPWLKEAEQALTNPLLSDDKEGRDKLAALRTRLNELIWSVAQEIISEQEEAARAVEDAHRKTVSDLLEVVDELTAPDPNAPKGQWEQPSTKPSNGSQKGMR